MGSARLPPLELTSQTRSASAAERWFVAGIWTMVLGFFLWMRFLVLGGHFHMDPDALAQTLTRFPENLRDDPIHFADLLLLPFIAAVHIWFSRRRARLERVFLDETGIRYQSPLAEALSWSLPWSQVRELHVPVSVTRANRPYIWFFKFDAGQVSRNLDQPLLWVPADAAGKAAFPEEPAKRERFFTFHLSTPDRSEETRRRIEQSPIVRYARQAGVTVSITGLDPPGFALESNRHTAAAAVLAVVLLFYGSFDIQLNDESYAVAPPLVLFPLGGALAALACTVWLLLAGAPRVETLVLALLLGVATGIALYPGPLRLNEATDSQGLRSYDYRLTRYSVFAPVEPGPPELDFSKYSYYWHQFQLGTIHQFELRKGGLGFYQVDMAPVRDRMGAYFRGGK